MIIRYINHIRTYHPGYTSGELIVPWSDSRFCYVLEDIARPTNVKFPGLTCIPEGIYVVNYSVSSRFKKEMISLSNQPNGYEIIRNGVSFKGVRAHGGNNVTATHGCPLLNYENNNDGTMYGRASDDLLERIKIDMKKGVEYRWIISSK